MRSKCNGHADTDRLFKRVHAAIVHVQPGDGRLWSFVIGYTARRLRWILPADVHLQQGLGAMRCGCIGHADADRVYRCVHAAAVHVQPSEGCVRSFVVGHSAHRLQWILPADVHLQQGFWAVRGGCIGHADADRLFKRVHAAIVHVQPSDRPMRSFVDGHSAHRLQRILPADV